MSLFTLRDEISKFDGDRLKPKGAEQHIRASQSGVLLFLHFLPTTVSYNRSYDNEFNLTTKKNDTTRAKVAYTSASAPAVLSSHRSAIGD